MIIAIVGNDNSCVGLTDDSEKSCDLLQLQDNSSNVSQSSHSKKQDVRGIIILRRRTHFVTSH